MALSDDTFGAMLVGVWIAIAMYGMTTLQTYYYYYHYPKDRMSIKILVGSIWALDTLHVIFMCHAMYYYLIKNFGNTLPLAAGNWSLISSITINVVIAFVVQAFFTQRIYALCRRRKWLITGVIGFTVLGHFVFGIETVVFIYIKKEFSRLREMQYYAAVPFAIFVVLSDVLISAALCTFLDNSRTGYEDTNSMINRLMVFSINRCVLICVVAIVELVVFIAKPHSLYVFAVDFIVGKLYANSLLASLNSRMALRQGRNEIDSTDISTSFNLATMPHSTIRTETTADVRAEQLVRLNSTDGGELLDEKGKSKATSSSSDHLSSITSRRPGHPTVEV
ncbi:hypothetical protein CC1G_12567 [Coprinopsis cinerea okayama7|uniref:DUF6534 domain-containing protein n=1 Tax=Coprinopsis cinerea (strain Okayama-7 / 130 / ATCC MYA-4618 / FGSC 9003) TaxID=240176 RepID=A8NU64_COPC7|nr:hypothetical protein CC1G_12567 [Coprinopsis cinerea okayama7\|eukprot:XP_001836386.2 hypothetical protein CC1G_12567 [Coprinopsis cinerea okayama7\